MKNIKLSQRQKNIIKMLPDKEKQPITINDIAKSMNLSSRTVQRDLIDIEQFLQYNHFELIKKPGMGLIMNESREGLAYLYELLNMIDSHKHYDREKRINFILSRLLSSNQAIKYQAFTAYLNISEKTLVDDLLYIEKWLNTYSIKLVRKKGEGITISGDEKFIRKAQADLIYQNLNEDSRLELLRDINEQAKIDLISENNILNMIDRDIIDKTRIALNESFNSLNISISDNSYIGLVVHISLAIERLKLDEEIEISPIIKRDLEATQEYMYAERIVEYLEKQFNQKIPVTEVSYIAMHIKGANIIARGQDMPNMDDILQAHFISKALIDEMNNIFNLNLNDDKRLESDLIAHLSPALTRLKHNLNIRNPILNDIKNNYSEIYYSLSSIVPNILCKYYNLPEDKAIPEDEIGYIAIHFISSIESKIIERSRINILTVCPTGYGTSRLLATNLVNNINNINVVGNASIMKLNNAYLNENKVDLVISTVNLENIIHANEEIKTPIIEVSAIISENDIAQINHKINKISREKYYEQHIGKTFEVNERQNNKNISNISELTVDLHLAKDIYSTSINLFKIFDNIKYFNTCIEENLEKNVAQIVATTKEEAKIIEKALVARNKISSTFFPEYNLHLLHATCSIEIPKLAFGKLINNDEIIIVMLNNLNNPKYITELFGNISSRIVDSSDLINMINNFRTDEINNVINNEILNIINNKITRGKNNES